MYMGKQTHPVAKRVLSTKCCVCVDDHSKSEFVVSERFKALPKNALTSQFCMGDKLGNSVRLLGQRRPVPLFLNEATETAAAVTIEGEGQGCY